MGHFKSIRPFNDSEIRDVLGSLCNSQEVINLFAQASKPNLWSYVPFYNWIIRNRISRLASSINSVDELQNYFKKLVSNTITNSIEEFTSSGVENLDTKKNYLFVSNHRDITLDPALLNFVINKNGHQTSNIAVGNNLMSKEWAANLMRLNKSFIIQRDGESKKEIYNSLILASEFINHCLNNHQSVWIAQKQGRAKDGIDKTDPAILKMIHLMERKNTSPGEFFNGINLIPVSIAYVKDPNDLQKAIELAELADHKNYQKGELEDLQSIARGIKEQKGRVHLSIGKKLELNKEDDYKEIASKLTAIILKNYKIFPTNIAAYELVSNNKYDHSFTHMEIDSARNYLQSRIEGHSESIKRYFLYQYANAVIRLNEDIST